MPQTINYTIVNSQVLTTQREVEVNGQTGTFSFQSLDIECLPTDHDGKTLTLNFAPELADQFHEGAAVVVTIDVVLPAQAETPADQPAA